MLHMQQRLQISNKAEEWRGQGLVLSHQRPGPQQQRGRPQVTPQSRDH